MASNAPAKRGSPGIRMQCSSPGSGGLSGHSPPRILRTEPGPRVREELVHSGAFYLVKTRMRDRTYLRTTIINARTTESDLSALLTAIRAAVSRQLRHLA